MKLTSLKGRYCQMTCLEKHEQFNESRAPKGLMQFQLLSSTDLILLPLAIEGTEN